MRSTEALGVNYQVAILQFEAGTDVGVLADDVALLIDRGADLDATNDQGWTALMFAANTDSHESGTAWCNPITPDIIVQWLLDAGADPIIVNNEGKKAVQYAFQNLQIDGKWTFRNLYDVSDWSP